MKAEIICIIDRSGSMAAIASDAIGGFNTFLDGQKKVPGEATLTFVQFDTEYEVVHENKPLHEVPALDERTYQPRGGTALLDAVGRTIDDVGRRLSNMAENNRPEKVIVAILTDGEENSSRQYSLSKIEEMITHQKDKYQWDFIFLGANQDAFAEAAKIGIDAKYTANFVGSAKGIHEGYKRMGGMVMERRSGFR